MTKFYAGVDPGFEGAIALINAAGTTARVWPMPVKRMGGTNYRALDLDKLAEIFREIKKLPSVLWGLENPTTRPDEGAERSARFGRQLGVLESFIYLHGFTYSLIPPATWTGKLGVDGKSREGAQERTAGLWASLYPQYAHLIRGPRNGVLSGPLDACMISHYLRLKDGAILRSATKGSAEHLAAVLACGPGKRKLCRMPIKE